MVRDRVVDRTDGSSTDAVSSHRRSPRLPWAPGAEMGIRAVRRRAARGHLASTHRDARPLLSGPVGRVWRAGVERLGQASAVDAAASSVLSVFRPDRLSDVDEYWRISASPESLVARGPRLVRRIGNRPLRDIPGRERGMRYAGDARSRARGLPRAAGGAGGRRWRSDQPVTDMRESESY